MATNVSVVEFTDSDGTGFFRISSYYLRTS